MIRHFQTKTTIRFRRWSRAGYAIFRSLRNCVSIGFLKITVADSSLRKSNDASGNNWNIAAVFGDDSEYDEISFFENFIVDTLLLQKQLVSVANKKNEYARREGVSRCRISVFDG